MKKKIITIIGLILCFCILTTACYATDYYTNWTKRQNELHEMAEAARAQGKSEDDDFIKQCSQEWWQEQENVNIIAKVIWKEAGACPWKHRVCVGQVVLNRVNSEYFPNTVKDVVGQTSSWYDAEGNLHSVWQYNPSYCYDFSGIPEECYEDAIYVLDGKGSSWIPSDLFWQAEFPQGREVWWKSHIKTEWGFESTTYFCRGVYGS